MPGSRRVPFFAYAFLFLFLPAGDVMRGAFKGEHGGVTLGNLRQILNHPYIDAYKTSIEVSLVTALDRRLRRPRDRLRSAPRRHAPLGPLGAHDVLRRGGELRRHPARIRVHRHDRHRSAIATTFMKNQLGIDIYAHGFTLFSKTGVEIVYLYFQLPLMILVIAPAIDGLRREWREAASNLGASSWQYWRYVGLPVLVPSLLGAIILLFGNSFAAYATAYSLTSRRSEPRADRHRRVLHRQRVEESASRTGARVRDVPRSRADDGRLYPVAATRRAVGEMRRAAAWRRRRTSGCSSGRLYFFIPLLATSLFGLKRSDGQVLHGSRATRWVIHDGDFWHTLKISLLLALETIVISLLLFVPTIYWVHLKLPRLRPVIAFLALIPFVVPPIVMVVGLLSVYKGSPQWFYGKPWGFLVAAYVILAFPYMFFSLDAGFRRSTCTRSPRRRRAWARAGEGRSSG